jgi:hypothetical protein
LGRERFRSQQLAELDVGFACESAAAFRDRVSVALGLKADRIRDGEPFVTVAAVEVGS